MKTVSFNITAKNAKNQQVNFNLSIAHSKKGITHIFTATSDVDEIAFGEMPSGYVDSKAISKIDQNQNGFQFGTGELKRQGTYPFVAYLKSSERNRKDRLFFTIPVSVSELLLMLK